MIKKSKRQTRAIATYHGPVEVLWKTCKIDKNESDEVAYERGLKIESAAECAITRGRKCLNNTNKSWFNKITSWFNRGKKLRVDCGPPKNSKDAQNPEFVENFVAQADSYNSIFWKSLGDFIVFLRSDPEILFNPKQINGLLGCASTDTSCISQNNDDKLCNIFLHELMHHMDRIKPHPDHDKYEIDEIYSCGRYCGGCAQNLLGATGDPHADCLRCAGTFDEKLACGYIGRNQRRRL